MKFLKGKINKKTGIVLIVLWLILFSSCLVTRVFQNDTYYTIKIGEWIVNNGIDMMDHFSIHNLAYTYPHWLYDVMIYSLHSIGGLPLIWISTIFFFSLLIVIIFFVSKKLTNKVSPSLFAAIFCTIALSSRYATARAQLITYILFVLEILLIELLAKTGKKKYGIFLFLISLLICNMHVAVWPFFFILFLPYIAEGIINKVVNKYKGRSIRKFQDKFINESVNLKALFIVIGLCLLTGLITPIHLTPYTYLIKTMMGNSQSYIVEHQIATFQESILVIVMVAEILFLSIFNRVKLRDLFLILGLSIMAISSNRHIGLLGFIGSIAFARTFALFLDKFDFDADKVICDFLRKRFVVIISFILVICFNIIMMKQQLKNDYVDAYLFPTNAADYINENVDKANLRMYNDYNYGSYLMYKDIPVFIDSRADLYTKEFSGKDFDVFDDFMNVNLEYDRIFEFYDFNYAMTYTDSDLYKLLFNDKKFVKVFSDDVFAVFKKLEGEENE